MKPWMRTTLLWLAWGVLIALALLYPVELYAELQRGQMEPFSLSFHLIPEAILFLALGLSLEAFRQKSSGMLKPWLKRLVYWTPRIALLFFTLMISLLALDIFDMGLGFWETILGLLIHLIPAMVMALAIALAWRWEWVGGVFFIGWAVWYAVTAQGFPLSVYVEIAGLPLALGLLFLINWRYRDEIRQLREAPKVAA